MSRECWCPNCRQYTRARKVNGLMFVIMLFVLTPLWPFYLLYCAFSRHICNSCGVRVRHYDSWEQWSLEMEAKANKRR